MNFDQLYADFSEKLLPKIQEGLVITKDYFVDFAGRYVKYLLIMDSVWVILSVLLLIVSFVCAFITFKLMQDTDYLAPRDDGAIGFLGLFTLCVFIMGVFSITHTVPNLIKTIYIPEVRIIEEIQYMRNN